MNIFFISFLFCLLVVVSKKFKNSKFLLIPIFVLFIFYLANISQVLQRIELLLFTAPILISSTRENNLTSANIFSCLFIYTIADFYIENIFIKFLLFFIVSSFIEIFILKNNNYRKSIVMLFFILLLVPFLTAEVGFINIYVKEYVGYLLLIVPLLKHVLSFNSGNQTKIYFSQSFYSYIWFPYFYFANVLSLQIMQLDLSIIYLFYMVLTVFCLFKMVFITNIQTKMDSYFTAISSLLIICIIKSLEVKYLCIGLSLVILCLEVLQSYKKVDQVYQKFIFFLLVVSGIIGPAILMLKTTQNEQLITNGILISSSLIMFYLAKLNIIKLDGKKVYYKLQQ